MSDETYLLQRIMGLETELSYFAENSRQQQIRHNTEISRLQNDNRKLQARFGVLQAENTLRVQLEAALSVISYLEQRLKFHLKIFARARKCHRWDNTSVEQRGMTSGYSRFARALTLSRTCVPHVQAGPNCRKSLRTETQGLQNT